MKRNRRVVAVVLAALLAMAAVATTAMGAVPTLRSAGKVRPVPKKVATQPPTAPPPVELSANGVRPDVIVDAAGTAHIVWNEPVDGGPDVTVYCRLPRAAKACEVTQRLVPPGADALADDADGPQVSAVNDQVTILSHRYPQPVPKPGGDPSIEDTTLYLWTSDDGGSNFVGPGVVGTATIGGEARAFGPGDNPSIGTVTGQATGGIRFTGLTSGRFVTQAADLAVGGFTDGRLTVINGIPTVAYHDLGSTSYVQTWSGQGDVNDAATWGAPQTFPGLQPEIGSAAGRLVAVNQKPDGSGDLELRDLASGLARTISTGGAGARAVPLGHSDGTVSVVWQGAEDGVRGLWQRDRIGPTGPIRGTPTLLSTEEGAFLSADSADDGGGVAVRDTLDRKILLTAFGNTLPTAARGLGGAPGGGAPPADVAVGCQKIQLGRATQVLLPPGPCFLNASTGGLKISQGPLRLNGMEIVPDAGVQLQIDLNAKTIRSTGTATVLLRAPGIPDITLFRGRIDLSAAGKGSGSVLGQFGEKLFKPDLLGFPLRGDIDLKLRAPDGLRIPVSLELPKELGNIRGSAELILDNSRGLSLDSLDFAADGVPLGPATMRKLQVQYRAQGGTTVGSCLVPPNSGAAAQANEWAGVFELELPPPKTGPRVCGSIRFGQPEGFREATFRVDIPYPGIVLFPGLSLTSLGGGLRLSPKPARVDGRFKIEVAGAAPDVSAAQMVGELGVTLSNPLVIQGRGTFTAAGLQIGTGQVTVTTDGYANLSLESGPKVGPVTVETKISGFVDGPHKQFSLGGKGRICVNLPGGVPGCLDGSEATISTKGVAACLPAIRPPIAIPIPPYTIVPPRGAGLRWGDTTPAIWPIDCYAADYAVADQRAAAVEHATATEAGADLAGGASANFRVAGDAGVPAVDLIDPSGAVVAPDVDYPDATSGVRYLGVATPAAGRWTVRTQAGSPPIAELAVSRGLPAPKVTRARVTGKGPRRTLSYTATLAAGQAVTFVERGGAGSRVIGAGTAGSRRLTFVPGPGPGGRRQIVAQLIQNDLVREEVVVTSYVAPRPPALGRTSGLRIRRAGSRVVVTWRPGANAAAQRIDVRVPAGPSVSRILGGRASRLVVGGIDGRRVSAAVTPIARSGRAGAATRATLAPAPAPKATKAKRPRR